MPKPSVEDVNANRVAKFTDAITAALEDAAMPQFRELVSSYAASTTYPRATSRPRSPCWPRTASRCSSRSPHPSPS